MLNEVIKLPREWQMKVSDLYPAPDLLPKGRIESRYSVNVGLKRGVQRGKGEIVVNATALLNMNKAQRMIRGTHFRLVSTDYLETHVT